MTTATAPPVKFHPNAIQTYTGEAYDFADPDPRTIHLDDIAHSLSNMCRFAGHVRGFQSVAEHSVLVSEIVRLAGGDTREQQLAFLHDGHEGYVWDCPRPFKPLLGDVFEQFAEKADEAILSAFFDEDIPTRIFQSSWIKEADNIALVAEARELMHHGPESWAGWKDTYSKVPDLPAPLKVRSLLPHQAENLFLHRAFVLGLNTEA